MASTFNLGTRPDPILIIGPRYEATIHYHAHLGSCTLYSTKGQGSKTAKKNSVVVVEQKFFELYNFGIPQHLFLFRQQV